MYLPSPLRSLQDDGRPGFEERSAWVRLRTYLEHTGLRIVAMWLQFRSNSVTPLPDNASGYFFSKSVMGMLTSTEQFYFYLVGYINSDGAVVIYKYCTPELMLIEVEERGKEASTKCLIENRL